MKETRGLLETKSTFSLLYVKAIFRKISILTLLFFISNIIIFTMPAHAETRGMVYIYGNTPEVSKSYTSTTNEAFKVTFNSQGGTAVPSKTANSYGKISYPPTIPLKSGYSFDGWFTALSGGRVVEFPYKPSGNITLYARWKEFSEVNPEQEIPGALTYGHVRIHWFRIPGASGYKVYRATSPSGKYVLVGTVPQVSNYASPIFTNTALDCGITYYYKVRAYQINGTTRTYSKYSEVKSAKPIPNAPSYVTTTKTSATSIKNTWSSVSGANGYEVYYATSSTGKYSRLSTTKNCYYTKTGLATGRTYYLKVRAYKTVNGVKIYTKFSLVNKVKM